MVVNTPWVNGRTVSLSGHTIFDLCKISSEWTTHIYNFGNSTYWTIRNTTCVARELLIQKLFCLHHRDCTFYIPYMDHIRISLSVDHGLTKSEGWGEAGDLNWSLKWLRNRKQIMFCCFQTERLIRPIHKSCILISA